MSICLASQDLNAFYFEAAIARPDSSSTGSGAFNRWVWSETATGQVLKAVKERCVKEKDEALRMTGAMMAVETHDYTIYKGVLMERPWNRRP